MDWDTTQATIQIPDLAIQVKVRRGFFKKEWVDIQSYLLSNTHCIIKTDELFPINEKITLSLILSLDPSDLIIDSITANVLNQKKECSCFFYHLEFNQESIKAPLGSESPISRMVELIEKKQLINKKVLDLSHAST